MSGKTVKRVERRTKMKTTAKTWHFQVFSINFHLGVSLCVYFLPLDFVSIQKIHGINNRTDRNEKSVFVSCEKWLIEIKSYETVSARKFPFCDNCHRRKCDDSRINLLFNSLACVFVCLFFFSFRWLCFALLFFASLSHFWCLAAFNFDRYIQNI